MEKENNQPRIISTIKIGDKVLPCRVTMGAMVRFKRAVGHDVSQLDSSNLEDLLTFIWCCVVSACKADSVDFDMDFETFADNLDAGDVARFFQGMGNAEDIEKKTIAPST